jgi:hypothetical protein
MISQFFSGPVGAESSATRDYQPGEVVVTNDSTYGTRVWRYIKNTEAATALAVGTIVERKASTVDNMQGIVCVTNKKVKEMLLGVAQVAVAAGRFAFVLKEGIGYVLGDGSVTAGSNIRSNGTSGRAMIATMTNLDEVISQFGVALEDDAAAGSTFRANICIP